MSPIRSVPGAGPDADNSGIKKAGARPHLFSLSGLGSALILEVVHDIAHGLKRLRLFVADLALELFLESHD